MLRRICAALCVLAFVPFANAAPPLSGAIFTTTVNGDVVNGNTKYEFKTDVYLDGGPPLNAPQQAAGLPDGDYYFQVTDPSGKKLLSTDPVKCRRITVFNGIITSVANSDPACVHNTGSDVDHPPAITVQLYPFIDTPNNGGVYKAWVTPVGDGTVGGGGFVGDPDEVDNQCGNGCFHGFVPARSKTDNFKVNEKEPTFCLDVYKERQDKNGTVGVENWEMFVTDPLGVTNNYFTDATGLLELCGLTAGVYTVTESLTSGGDTYAVIFTEVNGVEIMPPTETVEIHWTAGKADPQIVRFFNEFLCDKNCN
jgi:hypothetical protein